MANTNAPDDIPLRCREDVENVFDILMAVDEYGARDECCIGDAKARCSFCSADPEWGAWDVKHTDKCPVTRARRLLTTMSQQTYPERMHRA
jgi:hypothetical protein